MLFLKMLADPRMLAPSQDPTSLSIANIAPKTAETKGNNDCFFCPLLGSVLKKNENDVLTKFQKLKSLVYLSFETEDAYELNLDYYERLHKLGIDHQYGVEFVSLQLQG